MIRENAGLKIIIAGANPGKDVLSLQNQHISILGDIQDMAALKKTANLFIAPMFLNTGIQNKILEAMVCEVPVLTTPQAAEAIGAIPLLHLFIALSAEEFATEAKNILNMPGGEREKLCAAAKQLTVDYFDWETNCLLMEPCFY